MEEWSDTSSQKAADNDDDVMFVDDDQIDHFDDDLFDEPTTTAQEVYEETITDMCKLNYTGHTGIVNIKNRCSA